jgi:hypothetical protein
MGLDMYLSKKHYIKNWDHTKPEERFAISVRQGGKRLSAIKPQRVTNVVEEVAYWRKANQIHRWFVENVQDGNDDCKEYYVSREKLKELLDTVNTVLQSSQLVPGKVTNGYTMKKTDDGKFVEEPILQDGQRLADPSVAHALLPTQEGFFFGGTEYDQYYHEDLVYTRDVLTKALAEAEADGAEFYYQSSW